MSPATARVAADAAGERQHGEDRQRGPRQPGEGVAIHHTRSVALRLTPAMDERDPEQVPGDPHCQARPSAHAGAALVEPADRHDGHPVAAPAREIDELDVEDDARDPLAREQVLRRLATEPLEPALRVLDRPDDPDRRQHVEALAEQPAVARLRRPHVRPIGLDARTEGDVVVDERRHEQRDLIRRRRHVGIREDHEFAGRREHAGTHGGALAAVRDAADVQPHAVDRARGLGSCLDDVDGPVRAAVVDDEDLDLRREGRGARAPHRGLGRRAGAR